MSASLVGSEMCIRDRRPSARAAPSITQRGIMPPGIMPGIMPRGNNDSVSYTHLTLPTICSV
eukprot:1095064-Alexandrium_andersonii.AAC.1